MNEIMIDLQGGAKAPLYEKIYMNIKKMRLLTVRFPKGKNYRQPVYWQKICL